MPPDKQQRPLMATRAKGVYTINRQPIFKPYNTPKCSKEPANAKLKVIPSYTPTPKDSSLKA